MACRSEAGNFAKCEPPEQSKLVSDTNNCTTRLSCTHSKGEDTALATVPINEVFAYGYRNQCNTVKTAIKPPIAAPKYSAE